MSDVKLHARQKKGDWVVMGGKPGELAYCTRCGQGLSLNMPQLIAVVVAASKAFVKAHSNCAAGQYIEKPAESPEEWANGRDTGTSSLTIYSAITGMPSPHGILDVPYDPSDFGRCYRLLKLFPAWRPQLNKVVGLCEAWRPFVEAWDELAALYEEELPTGTAPKLYARMTQLYAQQPTETEEVNG